MKTKYPNANTKLLMKPRLKSAIILVFLMIGLQLFAQVPFTEVPGSTLTINGELKIIGNAIVGLNQTLGGINYNPNDDYDGTSFNNRRTFGYIDVDGDGSTFSSSSADLDLTSGCERIAYAGLYWAASYFVERTSSGDNVQYTGLPFPDNRPEFRSIKIRHQSQPGYTTITPAETQVIYDGYRNTAGNPSNAAVIDIPYVCYADVTSYVQGLGVGNANGTYTIADMRAATGFAGFNSNGISGGWVLVVAYEDPTLSAKFISTRQGYLVIAPGDPLQTFNYSNFETLPLPFPVRARYAVATLEGDRPFAGDIFQVRNTGGTFQDVFTTPANPSGNFFDSSITIDGNYVTNRTPASENTLGFDADIFDIDNPGNTVIGNNQTSAEFATTSAGDAYSLFFNSFQIEIISPKLTVTKRVFDNIGTDITGDPVNFADQLFYELTIENQGNEDVTGLDPVAAPLATIRDILPANVDFTIGSITTSNPGIVATYDAGNREINITIEDALIVRGGGVHNVRFGVQVVATCADLRDACSNQINNVAISSYRGVDSDIERTGESSILEQDACQADIEGSSNVLINNGICFNQSTPAFICTGSIELTAGDGFTNYDWTYIDDPTLTFPNSQTITVTLPGTYTVLNSGAPGCQDSQQTFVVDGFTTVENPVIDIARNLGSNPNVNGEPNDGTPGTGNPCPINGEPLPEIFLCGAGTTLNIPLNFPIGTTVIWERLDPAACPTVTRDPNCPTPVIDSGVCDGDWVQVSTDIGSYTVTQSGEYRIRATFDSGCTIPFYFNVFQNNFDPELVVIREIICGTPGTLRVQNSSLEYEYQLISPSGTVSPYQASPEFVGLTTVGNYTVNVRQTGGLPTACVFQDSVFLDELDANEIVDVTSPTCPDGRGTISITVTDSQINYTYTINSTTTAFTDSEGPTTIPNHTFTGLVPDTYEVQVLSADGSCSETFTRVVAASAPFSATVVLLSDLSCNPGYQPDPTLNDISHPNYDPTALPYDPDELIAIYEVTVTGGSTNLAFNNQLDFLGTTLVPLTGTTYQFRATASGNYPVFVNDLDNSCTISAGSVDVTPYEAIEATATPINPDCSGSLGAIDVTITAGLAENPFTYILDAGTASEVRIGPSNNTTERFNNVDPTVSHTVTVEDQFGCDFVITPDITFTSPTGITATINDDFSLLSCTATPGAQAQVTAITGGSGTYEWSLNPAGPFTAIVGLPFEIDFAAAGSYTIYIRNQVAPPTDSCVESFPIVIDPLLEVDSVTITPGDQDCSNQTVDVVLSVSPFPLPGAAFYEFEVTPDPASGAAGTGTVAFDVATNYTFTNGVSYTVRARRSDTQCINTGNFTGVTVPEIQITSATQDKPVNCVGASDGILSFTVGNSASYTYTVTGPTVVAPGAGTGVTPVTIPSLSAGTYTITVTDTSLSAPSVNCSTSTTVDITEPLVALSFTPVVDDADCGNPTGTITVNAVGGRGGYEYELRDAAGTGVITAYQSSNIFSALAPATYTVFVRDDSDPTLACEVSQSVIVPVTTVPTIAAATGGDACYTPADPATQWITITLGVPAPVGPFTYSLDGGGPVAVAFLPGPAPANTFEIPNLAPGAHTVTVTNTGSTCSSNTVNFTINPELTITANLTKDLTCAPTDDATIEFTATGGDTTYTFDVLGPDAQTGVTSPASVNTAGTYQIRVTDGLGCIATSADIIVTPYEALAGGLTPIAPECPTDNGGITVTLTAGEGPFNYILDQGTPSEVSVGPIPDVTYTFNGVTPSVAHNITVEDQFGCDLVLGPLTLTPPAVITATINDNFRLLSCTATPGAQAQVTDITGGSGTYEWSLNPAGPFTPIVMTVPFTPFEVDFAAAGSYTIYIRNQVTPPTDSCVESFPIVIDPLLEVDDITFALGASDCTAQTIEVTATAAPAGPTYTYSAVPAPVSGDATTGVFVLNRGVTYTFTATRGDNSCDYSEDFREELVPEVQITNAVETSPTTCNGGADGALSFTVGNSAAFTYTITGPIAVPSGSGTGVTPVAVGSLEAGVYTITVTDSNLAGGSPPNCQTSTTVTITEPTVVTFTIDPVDQDCAADTNTVTISGVAGGSGSGYTYILNDSGGVAVGPSRPIATPYENVPNALGYQIIVTDGAGCPSAPQTLNINQLPQLDASVDAASDFCLDDGTVSFTINIDGTDSGTPDYTYNVTRSGVVVIADTNVGALTTFTTTPALTQPGDYVITITDSNGCPVVLPTQTIAPAVELVATQVADITCDILGAPVDAEFSFVVTGGYTPYDIAVSIDGGAFADHLTNATAPFANYTNGTAGSYVFRVTDDRGCTFTTLPIIVTDPVAPTITAPTVALDCFGDLGTAVITVTGTETPYQIDFQNTGTFVAITGTEITFPNLGEAVYPFTVRSSRGCLYPDDVEITTPDVISEVSRVETPVTCGGSATVTDLGAIDLTIAGGTGPYEYTLVRAADFAVRPLVPAATAVATPNPVTTGTTVRFEGLDFGQYFIFVTDDNGCEDNAPFGPFDIFSPPNDLVQNITVSATCPGGVTFEIDVQGGSGITPPADPPPGFDIRIVGEPSPGLGDFVPLDDSVGGATAVDATTPIRDHTYSGLSFNRTYILEVRDNATNCLYQELVPAVSPPSEPSIINNVITDVTCNPAPVPADGTLSFDVSAYDPSVTEISWEVFDFFTNVSLGVAFAGSDNTTPSPAVPNVPVSITGLSAGEYYVVVQEVDGTQCPTRLDFTIDIPDPIVSVATNQTPANSCGTNAQVIMDTSGGVQFAIPPTADGYQYALIADDGFGAPVTIPTLITDFALTSNVIDLGNTNGQVQHIFVIGNNDGCTFGPITVTTVVNPLPTVTAPAFVDDACTYDNNYTFQVVGTGLGTLTYQLDGGTAVTGSIDNENHVFTVSSAGTYTVTITDETGCTNTDTIDVYDPLLINAEFTTAPDCSSVPPLGVITTTLDPTSPVAIGTLTYELQDSTGTPTGNTSGDATGVYTDVAPGSYIVEVTDDGRGPAPGCSFTAPVSIEAPTAPLLLAQPNTQVTCNGDTDGVITAVLDPATLDPDPTVTYTYAITAPLASVTAEQASPVFSGLAPGSYTVRVTATKPNGTLSVVCTDDQVYTIDNPTVVVADRSIVDDLACGVANTVTPATIAITIDATTGTGPNYFVTVTQPDGVIRTRIPVPTPIPAPPAAALTIDAPVDGTYAFTVFDSNNCPLVLPTIDVAPLPVMTDPTVTPGVPIDCVTNVQAVTVSITGGAGPFDIVETSRPALTQTGILAGTGDVDPPPGVQTTATFNLPGVGNYVFEITDTTTGCTIQTPVFNVPEYDTIEATIAPSVNVACAGEDTGAVILTVTGYPVAPVAPGNYNYQVTNNTTGTVTNGTGDVASGPLTITGLEAGEIVVVVTATQTPLCDATTNIVTISEPDPLTLDIVSATIPDCNNALSQVVMDADGGNGPYEYAAVAGILVTVPIQIPADPVAFPLTDTFTLDPATSLNWVIFVRDANGCITPRQIAIPPVTVAPVINTIDAFVDDACTFDNDYTFTVTATSNVPIPPGAGTLTFSLDGGARVAGTVTGPNTATIDFPLSGPGTYSVVAFDENGCPSLPRTIEVYPELQVTAVFTDPTCRNNDATIVATVTGGSDITVNPGNFTFDLVDAGTGITIPGVTQTAGPGANEITFSSTVTLPVPGTDGIFPGDYRVEVTDSAINTAPGCTDTFDITVPTFVDPIPSGTPTPVSCFGGTDGTILVTLDSTADDNPPYQYEIVAGPVTRPAQSSASFTGLPAGTYDIVVTSDKGCSNTPPIQVVVGGPTAALNVVPAQSPYSCNLTNDDVFPVITLTISGGTAPYDVAYTGPSSSGSETDVTDADLVAADVQYNITAPVEGTYSITVTDENNCVFTTFNVIVPPFAIMTDPTITRDITAVNNGVISCNNPETVIVSITGGTGPFTFTEISGSGTAPVPPQAGIVAGTGDTAAPGVQTTATFTLPSVGNYVFQITDGTTTCTIDTAPYPIVEFDTIDAAITLGNDITCFNTTPPDGSVNLIVTGYTGPYTYDATNTTTATVVSGGGDTTTDPVAGLNIPGLEAGNIVVTVTATNTPFCDVDSNVVAITQPPVINITANQIRDESCNPGDDALIEAVASGGTGTLEYQLEDAVGGILVAFGSDPRFGDFGLDGGVAPAGIDYVVRVRDTRGCEQTDTINIQPPVPLVLNPIAPTTLDCSDSEDGVITATATGGQGVGTYFFSLTLPDGSVSARVNNGTDTFQWIDLKPGNYIVTVSDNLTCEAFQDPVVITAPPAVTVDVTPTGISCLTANPNNILVTGGGGVPGGYTYGYIFTDATTGAVSPIVYQASDTFLNLPEGDYDFYVRDTNLCESPASTRIQVRNPDPLAATLDMNNFNIVCFGEPTGSVDAVATGGLGSYGYRVNGTDYLGAAVNLPGPTATDTQTTSFFGDLLAGTYTYTVTSGDCVDIVLPFTIVQPDEFIVEAFETPISCNGETDGTIRVTAVGGTSPQYFFSLYNSAGDAVFTFIEDDSELPLGEHTFTDLPADTYRVEVEDNNGCPREVIDILIIEPDAILGTVDATTPEECAGDMNGTATISITGGLQPAPPASPVYFWSIDGVTYLPVPDPTALVIPNLPGGVSTVFIRDSQNNPNCQGAVAIDIVPGVNLGATLEPRLVCPIYDYTDPTNPVMTSEEQYFIDFNIIADSEGLDIIYTLNGINGTPNPPSNSNLTGTFEVAPGEYEGVMESQLCTRTIGTIEIIDYTPLAIPVAEMTNNPQDPNEYRILASGGRQFENDPLYAFSFTILEEGMTLNLLQPSAFTELDSNIFVIRETANYVLRVVDADGCEVLSVVDLTYINIRIPNYFRPNPNDPNISLEEQFWYPRQITPNIDDPFFFENMEVTIFDRYGRMLKEFKGDQQGWSGTYQGKMLPSGDYWYTIILNDVDNREFTGHFTLYR